MSSRHKTSAQTFVEYVLFFGIVVTVLVAMTPAMKWGIQGIIKGVADQVGVQKDADQEGGTEPHLQRVESRTEAVSLKRAIDDIGKFTYIYNDTIEIHSDKQSLVGFRNEYNR